jgi:hypothetical protein
VEEFESVSGCGDVAMLMKLAGSWSEQVAMARLILWPNMRSIALFVERPVVLDLHAAV